VCCQCGEVGFQWCVGVEVADHGNASEQRTEKSAKVELPSSEISAVLFYAQRGVESDFYLLWHFWVCLQNIGMLWFELTV